MEATTGYLIKYCMDSIAREEKLSMGATGQKKLLSFKEKFRLLRDFLDMRANPHKNRLYQMKKTLIVEKIKKEEEMKKVDAKARKLARMQAATADQLSKSRQSGPSIRTPREGSSPSFHPSRRTPDPLKQISSERSNIKI